MMEMYHFVTSWVLDAPIESVWKKIVAVEAYPSLWSGVRQATIRGREPEVQLGSLVDYAVKAPLPTLLRFSTEVTTFQPPDLIEFRSSGDLDGHGKLTLRRQPNGTVATFSWDVGLTNPLLNLLGKVPFIKRMMAKSHNHVMTIARGILESSLRGQAHPIVSLAAAAAAEGSPASSSAAPGSP